MTSLKRRKLNKTNYKRRLGIVKSNKPRLVIRVSNRYITAQIIEYKTKGDITISSANSKELSNFKWKFTKNLPSAYLIGYMLGKKSKVKECVLDVGVKKPHPKGRVYAVLKGILDAGVSIPHNESILPSEDRVMGKHINEKIAKEFENVKKQIEMGKSVKKGAKKK